jgi:hypothetical protein
MNGCMCDLEPICSFRPITWLRRSSHTCSLPRGRVNQVVEPFRLLLRCALAGCEFDEAQYQLCNPDVADAVPLLAVASTLSRGYFKGPVGAGPTTIDASQHSTVETNQWDKADSTLP